jgi:hypothetical protein
MTALPKESVTATTNGWLSVVPTWPIAVLPDGKLVNAGAPACAVTMNVCGLPTRPVELAVTVYTPAFVPSFNAVTA